MKKLGFNSVIQAAIIASLISPQIIKADYDSVNDLVKDTNRVEGILNHDKSTGSSDDLNAIVEAAAQAKSDQVKKVEEVIDLSKKKNSWEKKVDTLKSLPALQNAVITKALKKRDTDLKKAQGLKAQLGDTTSFVNPNDFNTSNLPKACKKGVDFSQTRQLLDQMNSEPGQYLERQLGKFLDEKIQSNKEAQAQKILDAINFLKEKNSAPEEISVAGTDPLKKDYVIEKHIELLKNKNKTLKNEHKELTNSFLGEFGKFAQDLFKLRDSDEKVGALGAQFAKSMENVKKQTREATMGGIEKLFKNCTKERQNLFADIQNSKQTIAGYLMQSGTDVTLATQTAELDASAQVQRAQQTSCEDMAGRADALFQQGNLNNILNTMRSTKNPTDLLSSAVQAMSEVRNLQSQVGKLVKPLIQDCEEIAQGREALEQRVAQIGGGSQQNSSPAAGGFSGGVARNQKSSASSSRTH